jgi:hypothetical protein
MFLAESRHILGRCLVSKPLYFPRSHCVITDETSRKLTLFQGINTLALFPTSIHTEYCTNPTWLSTAISNPALFNVTLYICSVHIDGLRGMRESAESLSYKAKAIQGINETLKQPSKATSDETISAVLLLGNILVCSIF